MCSLELILQKTVQNELLIHKQKLIMEKLIDYTILIDIFLLIVLISIIVIGAYSKDKTESFNHKIKVSIILASMLLFSTTVVTIILIFLI